MLCHAVLCYEPNRLMGYTELQISTFWTGNWTNINKLSMIREIDEGETEGEESEEGEETADSKWQDNRTTGQRDNGTTSVTST